jgi:hypothetical protein
MLTLLEKALFIVLAVVSLYYTYRGFRQIIEIIRKGQPEYYSRFNQPLERIREALVRTLSQVTVFKSRPLVGFFHSFIFYGFTFYALVNLVDLVEGFFPSSWFTWLGGSLVRNLFHLGADVFGTLVLIGVVFFVWRRFVKNDAALDRFNPLVLLHPDVRAGGIRFDSFVVAAFIFLHVGFRLFGAGSLLAAEGRTDYWQPTATIITQVIGFGANRIAGWHLGWWISLGLILAFLPYFVRSKHIHIFAAPIRLGMGRRTAAGEKVGSGALDPINFENESIEQFGVTQLEQFRFSQLFDPYACIQSRSTNVTNSILSGKNSRRENLALVR